ncbi:hypothetical protein BCR34DRAFT_554433 [Clohesyomyces aquaticus]|uniref:Uncharacterized protein n=1 Tax=Clohesyomyces aquaticus TaxID=1231657 RepID=A0A1Y2A6R1_9PLEO|nr:hypothetical protein BCR34DRAFT_554433 [Clohesyomyces aquaticus]
MRGYPPTCVRTPPLQHSIRPAFKPFENRSPGTATSALAPSSSASGMETTRGESGIRAAFDVRRAWRSPRNAIRMLDGTGGNSEAAERRLRMPISLADIQEPLLRCLREHRCTARGCFLCHGTVDFRGDPARRDCHQRYPRFYWSWVDIRGMRIRGRKVLDA